MSQSFDDLVVQYAQGRINRRHLLRRALGVGLGAAALGGAGVLTPATVRRAAASQTPLDPPPGWPPYLPWPWGPGPTFPIPFPGDLLATPGVRWYVGGVEPTSGNTYVVGLSEEGNELSRYDFRRTGPTGVAYALSNGQTRLDGSMTIERSGRAGLLVSGEIDGVPYKAAGKDGGAVKVETAVQLETAKATLLAEANQLGESIWRTGQALTGLPSLPRAGCLGCAISGGGLALWGGGCVASTTIGIGFVCGGGWLVAAGTWADNCGGACGD